MLRLHWYFQTSCRHDCDRFGHTFYALLALLYSRAFERQQLIRRRRSCLFFVLLNFSLLSCTQYRPGQTVDIFSHRSRGGLFCIQTIKNSTNNHRFQNPQANDFIKTLNVTVGKKFNKNKQTKYCRGKNLSTAYMNITFNTIN